MVTVLITDLQLCVGLAMLMGAVLGYLLGWYLSDAGPPPPDPPAPPLALDGRPAPLFAV